MGGMATSRAAISGAATCFWTTLGKSPNHIAPRGLDVMSMAWRTLAISEDRVTIHGRHPTPIIHGIQHLITLMDTSAMKVVEVSDSLDPHSTTMEGIYVGGPGMDTPCSPLGLEKPTKIANVCALGKSPCHVGILTLIHFSGSCATASTISPTNSSLGTEKCQEDTATRSIIQSTTRVGASHVGMACIVQLSLQLPKTIA